MRVIVQRALNATVTIDGSVVGQIDKGFLLLVGIPHSDTEREAQLLAKKVANLRVMEDADGKMNLSLAQTEGAILSISQFTLYGDCRKGNRPAFIDAARPVQTEPLYNYFNALLRNEYGLLVEIGMIALLFLISCESSVNGKVSSMQFRRMDIAGAKALALASDAGNHQKMPARLPAALMDEGDPEYNISNPIFTVSEDGTLVEVHYTIEVVGNGEIVDMIKANMRLKAQYIYAIGNEWLWLVSTKLIHNFNFYETSFHLRPCGHSGCNRLVLLPGRWWERKTQRTGVQTYALGRS